ncbi:histidine phosphotransferase family protein [Shimia aestuarii]|uniref:Histidine phosphotransferase ChpT n=1 Tax=Shimia aestuarii TaxID=254406 RepID=A0A1I4T3B9_9RHOB|nr:histidine phosphotransferase family protein [Shimia aestuarii]SFM71186.1 histidine phosphotransferase ChpT [Shimia aestuarii]
MTDTAEIAGLVGSRICHDLISPVGAIGNGLELIGLTGGQPGPELDLISESVGNANARIRFFRIAFGLSGSEQMVSEREIQSILDGISVGARLQIDWTVQGAVERTDLRLAFLAFMCMETALPYGGLVSICHDSAGWSLFGEGRALKVDPDLWEPITRGQAPDRVIPAHVQFALFPLVASDHDRQISVEHTETRLTLRF